MNKEILLVFALLILRCNNLLADEFVFKSPRPLITDNKQESIYNNISGLEIMLSSSGIGLGLFYDRLLEMNYKFVSSIFYSGVKNTDELEYLWDWNLNDYVVEGKIRRLYDIGITAGLERYIDIGNLTQSFKPYIGVLFTPTMIWEMPYNSGWFDDVKYSKSHFRLGASVQIGADFGSTNTSVTSVQFRYAYIPFGGEGLESVIGSPIHNFGGFYLMLTIGGRW